LFNINTRLICGHRTLSLSLSLSLSLLQAVDPSGEGSATELTRPKSSWSILQEKVYGTRFANIDELKCKLIREWAKLDHEIIASAIRQ